jgi:hypothetical protein
VSYVLDLGCGGVRPNGVVCARLVSKKDNSQLYFQAYVYGRNYQVENIEYLPYSQRYAFADYDTLVAQSSTASDGLATAVSEIASRIGAGLALHGECPFAARTILAKHAWRCSNCKDV